MDNQTTHSSQFGLEMADLTVRDVIARHMQRGMEPLSLGRRYADDLLAALAAAGYAIVPEVMTRSHHTVDPSSSGMFETMVDPFKPKEH